MSAIAGIADISQRASVRLALAYGALFASIGVVLPYLPIWLEARGLSPEQIGWVTAVSMMVRLAAVLSLGPVADAVGRKKVLIGAGAVCLLAYGLHAPANGVFAIGVVAALAAGASGVLAPVLDAVTMRRALRENFSYGRVRSVGSFTFILSNIIVGAMIMRWGAESVLLGAICGAAGFLLAAIAAPRAGRASDDHDAESAAPTRAAPMAVLAAAFATSALLQGSHAFYYGFSSIAWTAQGFSGVQIGALWAWGVVCEIVFFAFFSRRAAAIGAPRLFAIGAVCGLVRWSAMAFAPGLGASALLQVFHAGTYAVTHLAIVSFIAQRISARRAATAQSLNTALTMGGALALATAASGFLYAAIGVRGYFLMTAMCALALAASLALASFLRGRA